MEKFEEYCSKAWEFLKKWSMKTFNGCKFCVMFIVEHVGRIYNAIKEEYTK